MTAEEDRLIAFLVGEIDRPPKAEAYRAPRLKQRPARKNRAKKKQGSWLTTPVRSRDTFGS